MMKEKGKIVNILEVEEDDKERNRGAALLSIYNEFKDEIKAIRTDIQHLNIQQPQQSENNQELNSLLKETIVNAVNDTINAHINSRENYADEVSRRCKNTDRTTWYQSLAYIVLDKQLESLLDEEEAYLMDNLIHSFKELLKYVEISDKGLTNEDNFFRFEIISNNGAATQQIIQLSSVKTKQAKTLEEKINKFLSGDRDIDTYTLLSIIKKIEQ